VGAKPSADVVGTGTFGKQTDEAEGHGILDKAAEAGINVIDTADIYPPGAEVGSAEIIVGRWLKNKRGQSILATKGGGKMGAAAWDAGNSRKHLPDAVDASLRRLNTDSVVGRQDALKLTRFVSTQPRYNLLFREVERELFPLAQ
jgi:1-deoxyxylulose-5-phosphate synthase